MKHDAFSVTAVLIFVAFAVERVTSGLLFLLSFSRRWDAFFSAARGTAQARRGKLAYYTVAGTLVLIVLILAQELRALRALDVDAWDGVDFILTWLLLVAGADRIAGIMGADSGAEPAAEVSKPLQIEGEVTLLDRAEGKSASLGH